MVAFYHPQMFWMVFYVVDSDYSSQERVTAEPIGLACYSPLKAYAFFFGLVGFVHHAMIQPQ
jgi:hypothetical protein